MKRKAFTLLELMICIAVSATLLGMLVPAMSQLNTNSMSTSCMNNLRVMARASMIYSTSNRGHFPPALLYGLDDDANTGHVRAWDYSRNPDQTVTPGMLWSYTDHPDKVLQCPGYDGPANWEGDPFTGYNYNVAFLAAESRMSWGAPGGSWDFLIQKDNLEGETSLTLAQCRRPGTTAIFGIGCWANGANKFMRSPVNESNQDLPLAYAGTQGFHYGGSTNFACIDGHVERSTTAHPGAHFDNLPASVTDLMGWPKNGFLSQDASRYDPR
ncbi:MAG: prepilin-type N-terminal cleavage/methylation domain-containing protein [Phycisphaerales bacterium]|nr:prepilin-type N-terminal cleavage/methylation domain-containing protein [Phycisphaerales bacterium]